MRYLFTVQYRGTNYAGWQIQPNGVSIQETIEKIFSTVLNEPTKIYASGRTDAGVHSYGQTFHANINKDINIGKFVYSINSLLPNDIYIIDVKEVNDDFHARYDVKRKIYSYYINVGDFDVFNEDKMYQFLRPLDIDKMNECLKIFLGEHNFQNFTSKDEDENNFVRTIYVAKLSKDKDIIKITLEGNGFMRYMVRFIVGTLIEVGLGKLSVEEVKNILESKTRKIISYKSPAYGLYLEKVIY